LEIYMKKMTSRTLNKVYSVALAGLIAMGLMGCADNEDEHGILKIKGDTASVEYTNEDSITYRGFRTLKTKHTDAVAIITLDPSSCSTDSTDDGKTGVFGYIFDLQKTKDNKKNDVYDFTAVSVRANGDKIQAYVSRFEGVDPNNMDGGNNFKDANGNELTTDGTEVNGHTAKETVILKGSASKAAYATLNSVSTLDDGTKKVAINVKASFNSITNKGEYEITFYDGIDAIAEEKGETDEDGNPVKTGQIKAGATALTISGNTTDNPVTVTASWAEENLSKPKQTDMGFYAAVYPGKTLVGSIQLPYILNEDEVVEWED